MEELDAGPGWYGKLPGAGDFVSRRLSAEFVHAWDEWLQHGMARADDMLGAGWIERAGVVRFWIAPMVVDRSAWTGLVLPSRDRVGRAFPLTAAKHVPPSASGLACALEANSWFAAVESVARHAIDAPLSVEEFERELANATALAPMGDNAHDAACALAATLLAEVSSSLGGATRSGATGLPPGSIWWHGDVPSPASCACVEALPSTAEFVLLFGGRGKDHG